MTVAELQRDTALALAQAARAEQARVRQALRRGELSLAAVMLDPPPCLRNTLLVDVIRWTRRSTSGTSITSIGRDALQANVNLMLAVGNASERTRAWVAEHGGYHFRPSAGTVR